MYDPLAQLAEHLTFNQGVWSSNLQWVTPICLPQRVVCGRGGMADAPDLGSGVFGRMSSSLIVRTVFLKKHPSKYVEHAVVAQLVERHLAKVEVAGPSPVYRSTCGCSSMAELQPSKLATRVRFPSPAPEKVIAKKSVVREGGAFCLPKQEKYLHPRRLCATLFPFLLFINKE